MNTAQHHPQPTQATNKKELLRLLRRRLQEHIDELQNPILIALQGSGLSVIEVALTWIELEEHAQRAYDEAYITTQSPSEALAAAQEARIEIAARLVAAKEGSTL
jgi:hypothetical protein